MRKKSNQPNQQVNLHPHHLALLQLLDEQHPQLVAMAQKVLHARSLAEEAVQAVACRLLDQADRFGQIDDIVRYTKTCVLNEARRLYRKQQQDQALYNKLQHHPAANDGNTAPDATLLTHERRYLLDQLGDLLSPAQKRVFDLLRANPDQSHRQIAGHLGCSHRNVGAILERIRRTIHRELPELLERDSF